MCACSAPPCGRRKKVVHQDVDNQGRRSPSDETSTDAITTGSERQNRRTHNLSVFDPPPSRYTILREKIIKSIRTFYTYWKKLRNDKFYWAIFKSILWFTVGLKLYNDLARQAKLSPLLSGESNKCPKIPKCPKPKCPEPPLPQCPKPKCPQPELPKPKCPKPEMPKPKCPEPHLPKPCS